MHFKYNSELFAYNIAETSVEVKTKKIMKAKNIYILYIRYTLNR